MFFRSFTLESQDSFETVIDRIATEIDRPWRLTGTDEPGAFRGSIWGNLFHLVRNVRYQNPCLPVAMGTVEKKDNGTEVRICLRPSFGGVFAIGLFLAVWWVMWSSWRLTEVLVEGSHWGELIVLFHITALALAMLIGGFRAEANIYVNEFTRIIVPCPEIPKQANDLSSNFSIASKMMVLPAAIFVPLILFILVNEIIHRANRVPLPSFEVRDPNSPTIVRVHGIHGWGSRPPSWGCNILVDGHRTTQHAGWPKGKVADDAQPTEVIWHSNPNWVEIVLSSGERLQLTWDRNAEKEARDTKAGLFYLKPVYSVIKGPNQKPDVGKQ